MIKKSGKAIIAKKGKALETLRIEYVPTDSIRANAYNPNRQSEHDFELLLRSMEEDGMTSAIIVQRDTREIVDGEHRWRAATKLGFAEIPVVFVDMTPEQMRIATLRHNRARGTEDLQLSAEVLRDLEKLGALDWAADSLLLSDTEIEKLLSDIPAPVALAGDEYSPAWRPTGDDESEIPAEGTEIARHGETTLTAASESAIAARRRQMDELEKAQTEEEREMIKRDRATYRVNLHFANEEANIVRSVLGERPADKLLSMCRAEAGVP